MRRATISLCCALTLLAGPGRAHASEVEPGAEGVSDDTEVRHAILEVDTSGTASGGPVIQRRIDERASVVLREAAVVPGKPGHSPTIRIIVSDLDAEQPGYGLELRLTRRTGELVRSRSIVCALCTEGELVDRAETEVQALVPLIEDLQPREASEEGSGTPQRRSATMTMQDADAPEATPDPHGKVLVGTGAALIATGVVGVGVGVGLALAPPRVDPDDARYEVSTRAPGLAVVGVGGAIAVVGAVLTGIGVARSKRRSSSPSVAFSFGRDHWIIGLGGRF